MERGLNPKLGNMILRIVLGVVFVAHGSLKLFPPEGGFAGGVSQFAGALGSMGLPLSGFFAWIVTLLEFFGGLALIVGFLVTPVAILICFHMLTGIVLVHARNGFFVVGPGQGGIEFNLVLIAGLLTLVFGGPGMAALDARSRGGSVTSEPRGGPGAAPGGGETGGTDAGAG